MEPGEGKKERILQELLLQVVTGTHQLQDQESWQQEVINDHDAAEENLKDTIALG